VVGRKKGKHAPPSENRPRLTVHQIVAYNFRRARESSGWTQVETSKRLERYLGFKLNQAGVSAIEKTYDSDRRRNIDVAEVVAFARCFGLPIGWFFLPPPGRSTDLVEPVNPEEPQLAMPVADLVAHAIGTPFGWDSFVARIVDLFERTDRLETSTALDIAFAGVRGDGFAKQIDLRRRALFAVTLARHGSHAERVVTRMAEMLVELVNLTPHGFDQLRQSNPDEALRLLAKGDKLVEPMLRSRLAADGIAGFTPAGGFDDLEPLDVEHAFDPKEPED
jgi:transcriptional regulator with XRE-family HTH domain